VLDVAADYYMRAGEGTRLSVPVMLKGLRGLLASALMLAETTAPLIRPGKRVLN
jgi:hypothetical protein